jgi:hypothetical protein
MASYPMFIDTLSHYLVGHYTAYQPDGVHIEARCTCGEKLEGVGHDESSAMSVPFDIEISHAFWGVYEPNINDILGAALNALLTGLTFLLRYDLKN